jgi:hypothetical protein
MTQTLQGEYLGEYEDRLGREAPSGERGEPQARVLTFGNARAGGAAAAAARRWRRRVHVDALDLDGALELRREILKQSRSDMI